MRIFDRQRNSYFEEKVYGEGAINLLWGDSFLSRTVGKALGFIVANFSFPSALFGLWAKSRWSQKEIAPFIEAFQVDVSEFEYPPSSFDSFDAFFTRTLKKEARPFDPDPKKLIIPADGRYLFYEKASDLSSLHFKGKHWSLEWLLQDPKLAKEFKGGSLVLGRLAPPDYHWFHFPCDGIPSFPDLIKGALFSVNPRALEKRPTILCENKRRLTRYQSPFGEVLLMEVGATNVGSIHEVFIPGEPCKKGGRKGYFSFGGSEVILLFKEGNIHLDQDLAAKTAEGVEVKCLIGESLGQWC